MYSQPELKTSWKVQLKAVFILGFLIECISVALPSSKNSAVKEYIQIKIFSLPMYDVFQSTFTKMFVGS